MNNTAALEKLIGVQYSPPFISFVYDACGIIYKANEYSHTVYYLVQHKLQYDIGKLLETHIYYVTL